MLPQFSAEGRTRKVGRLDFTRVRPCEGFYLADVHGVELGLKHLWQLSAEGVVVLHVLTLLPVQPL